MAFGTYVPSEVSIDIAGHIVSGYSDGSFVEAEHTNDRITMKKGADGETARVISSDDSGMITIRLQQTSASNDVLSSLFEIDIISFDGSFPIGIRDNQGNTLVSCGAAWIKKMPNVTFSNDVEDREWVIDCGSLAIFAGGN